MCCPLVEDDHIKLPRSKKCLIFPSAVKSPAEKMVLHFQGLPTLISQLSVSCVQGSLVSLITEIGGVRFGGSLA